MKHFTALIILTYLALCGMASAQTAVIRKTLSTNNLTEGFDLPSGQTIVIEAGATITNNGTATGFGSGTPGGSTTQLQYNNAGAFGGMSGWTTNGTTLVGGAGTTLAIGGGTAITSSTNLSAIAGLTSAADKLPYFTGSGTAAVTTITSMARSLLDDTTAGGMIITLGAAPSYNPAFTGPVSITDTDPGDATTITLTNTSGGVGLVFVPSLTSSLNVLFDNLTAARTIRFPDATGTLIGTGNLTAITGLTDSQISDTLTASLFVGSGSTTTAVDLATAEVAGTLPNSNTTATAANTANAIVARDASGNIAVGTLSIGGGTAITSSTKLAAIETLANGSGALTNNGTGGFSYTALGSVASLNIISTVEIQNSTIVNADISATAGIALSKLATDPLARANHSGTQNVSTLSGLGSGVYDALILSIGSAGGLVAINGIGGTPSSLTLTNATGLPLTTGVTGTLAVGNGGTGATTLASGLLYGNGTGAITSAATVAAINNITTDNDVAILGANTFTAVQTFAAGSVSAPSITTTGDTNTGVYFSAADEVSVATAGVQRVLVGGAGGSFFKQVTNTPLILGISDAGNTSYGVFNAGSGGLFLAVGAPSGNIIHFTNPGAVEFIQDDQNVIQFRTGGSRTGGLSQGASGVLYIGTGAQGSFAGSLKLTNLEAVGKVSNTKIDTTLAAAATALAVTNNFVKVTGDAGGNTLATITGGVSGQTLTLLFVDALVTITDTDAATANTVDLSAAFTSSARDTITLIFDGTKWIETSRSVN